MSVANFTTPTVTHAPTSSVGLTEKVSVSNLDFYYGDHRALQSINMSLYQGRVTAMIGPSGCGKSTLLRVLNRMYDLYPNQRATGQVRLDNEDILSPGQDLNLLRAKVGMLFQKPTPFPMTIYENIAFGIRLYERLPKSELDDRIKHCLQRAALWDEVKDKLNANGRSRCFAGLFRQLRGDDAALTPSQTATAKGGVEQGVSEHKRSGIGVENIARTCAKVQIQFAG